MVAVFLLGAGILGAKLLTSFGVGKLASAGEKLATGFAIKTAITGDLHYRAGEGITTEMVDPRGVLISLDSDTQMGRDIAVMAIYCESLGKYVGNRYRFTMSEGKSVTAMLRAPKETLGVSLGEKGKAGNIDLELEPLVDFLETFPARRTKKA